MRSSDWSSDVCSSDRPQLQQFGLAERLVDDAHAGPQDEVAPGLAREIAAEIAVGAEDDRLARGDLGEDLLRRRARDDDVGERLHRRRAVDIGERDRVRMLRAKRSEEHTSELQSLMRISYAVFCL